MTVEIETMDRSAVKILREELDQALSLIEGNFSVDSENATYSPDVGEVVFKVKFKIKGTESKKLYDAKRIASIVEIPESAFSTPVSAFFNGKQRSIIITGYKPKARKYPWIIKDRNSGSEFTVDQNYVQQTFRKVS